MEVQIIVNLKLEKMTGGEAIVKSLINEGVDTVFGLPGIQLDPMFNALHDSSNEIAVINARHEQGVAYMAFASNSPQSQPMQTKPSPASKRCEAAAACLGRS